MKITFLDVNTVGKLAEIENFKKLGEVDIYMTTKPNETLKRIKNSDIIITNKVTVSLLFVFCI